MKKNNGITLIALVITIIVLLILAGVSISLVLGENGVLTQATNAVNKNLEAEAKEDLAMAWAGVTTDYIRDSAVDSNKTLSQYLNKDKLNTYLTDKGEIEEFTVNNDVYTAVYELNKSGVKHKYSIQINKNGDVISINAIGTESEFAQSEQSSQNNNNNNQETFTFTIGFPDTNWNYENHTYIARKGMTWSEWCNSAYNTDNNFYIKGCCFWCKNF